MALAAALIARDVYEELDVPAPPAKLDELAAPSLRLGFYPMSAEAQALELAHYLYERHGFAGNEAAYYDPEKQSAPDVLERRLGIPITLALVYCEVPSVSASPHRGRFPGHFGAHRSPGKDRGARSSSTRSLGGKCCGESARPLLTRVMGTGEAAPRAPPPPAARHRGPHADESEGRLHGSRRRRPRAPRRRSAGLSHPQHPLALRDRGLLAAVSAWSRWPAPISAVSSRLRPTRATRKRSSRASRPSTAHRARSTSVSTPAGGVGLRERALASKRLG